MRVPHKHSPPSPPPPRFPPPTPLHPPRHLRESLNLCYCRLCSWFTSRSNRQRKHRFYNTLRCSTARCSRHSQDSVTIVLEAHRDKLGTYDIIILKRCCKITPTPLHTVFVPFASCAGDYLPWPPGCPNDGGGRGAVVQRELPLEASGMIAGLASTKKAGAAGTLRHAQSSW